jgi:hypothetical protein
MAVDSDDELEQLRKRIAEAEAELAELRPKVVEQLRALAEARYHAPDGRNNPPWYEDPQFLAEGFAIAPERGQILSAQYVKLYVKFLADEAQRRDLLRVDLSVLSVRSWMQWLEHRLCIELWIESLKQRKPGQRGPGKQPGVRKKGGGNTTPQKQLDRQRANYLNNKLSVSALMQWEPKKK